MAVRAVRSGAMYLGAAAVVVAAAAVLIAWPIYQTRRFVRAVEGAGGRVETGFEGPRWISRWADGWRIDLTPVSTRIYTVSMGEHISNEIMRTYQSQMRLAEELYLSGVMGDGFAALRGSSRLRRLEVEATAKHLARAGPLPLRELILRGVRSDRDLECLPVYSDLKDLSLSADITDAGLAHLAKYPTLRTLRLDGGRCTAAGFEQLRGLHLESLQTGVQFDDQTIEVLLQLPEIKRLDLNALQLTTDGLRKLARHPTLTTVLLRNFFQGTWEPMVKELPNIRWMR